MDTAEYDHAAYEDENNSDMYVYSAYGALVRNMKGQANMAVCEGYAMAFEYLCQLSGLDVSIIHGNAGSSMDDLGSHAWNIIRLDGDWYEIDVTWDDSVGATARAPSPDGQYAEAYEAMNADDVYYDKVAHTYFLLTTEMMEHRAPGENACTYSYPTVYIYSCGNEDYHIRFDSNEQKTADLVPTAYGTFYSYSSIKGE